MSRIDTLLQRVTDSQLRADLTDAVGEVRRTKDFGLVFESHLPETVRLPHHPIRSGVKVARRNFVEKAIWSVERVRSGQATLISLLDAEGLPSEEGQEIQESLDDLVVVAEFGDTIFPGLRHLGTVERGGDKPAHIVINGENHHALEALQFSHSEKVDCIYIDPPYNTGARDWKYDNNYVDGDDDYRHSKWLAFMQRRLCLARDLLNPESSVLIVTIDEKEYLRLGMLLEEIFPECRVQMVSVTTSPRSTARTAEFSRVDEYVFFVFVGAAGVDQPPADGEDSEVRWLYLRRTQKTLVRGSRPNQFYAVYVDSQTEKIVKIGDPLPDDFELDRIDQVENAVPVFPVDPEGIQLIWGLTGPTLQRVLDAGFVRVTEGTEHQPFTIAYLSTTNVQKVERGELRVTGARSDGSKIVVIPGGRVVRPTTVWSESRHDAGAYGTSLLRALLPGRHFPFPKSLYAVEDTLKAVIGSRTNAVVVDFFAGSGTTAHAVARMNRQDGGRRQSILVTNNEVSADEARSLAEAGHRPGDSEWESLGIFEHITRPRVEAAVTGLTPTGDAVPGDYKFGQTFPIAEGFDENVNFFELTYQDEAQIELDLAFNAIAPLLWLRAGGTGEIIRDNVDAAGRRKPYAWTDHYAVLFNVDRWQSFATRLPPTVGTVFVVTDSTAEFANIISELPGHIQDTVRLYQRYLASFAINTRRNG